MATQRTDYDSPWKEILELYFPRFLSLFFPDISVDIDWDRPYEFLDKELQQVVRDAETGGSRVDKLVRVWSKNGEETWVLIHIEVQGQPEKEFARRMYVYHYRLFDRYGRTIVSLAVLSDEDPNWHPTQYRNELWGVEALLKFRTVKLLDYRAQWQMLEQDPNPFAVVVMAHLKTQETRHDPHERGQWKWMLTRILYERGYRRQDVLELFQFIDWLMELPLILEQQFAARLESYQEEQRMKYVTTIERMAEQRGLERGLEQGLEQGAERTLREAILAILEIRFGTIPTDIVEMLEQIRTIEQLQSLHRQAITVDSLAAFEEVVAQITADSHSRLASSLEES